MVYSVLSCVFIDDGNRLAIEAKRPLARHPVGIRTGQDTSRRSTIRANEAVARLLRQLVAETGADALSFGQRPRAPPATSAWSTARDHGEVSERRSVGGGLVIVSVIEQEMLHGAARHLTFDATHTRTKLRTGVCLGHE
jgi:hypothetical protein